MYNHYNGGVGKYPIIEWVINYCVKCGLNIFEVTRDGNLCTMRHGNLCTMICDWANCLVLLVE